MLQLRELYNTKDECPVSVRKSKLRIEDENVRYENVMLHAWPVVEHFLQTGEYLWTIRSGLELQDPRPLPPTRNYSKSLLVRLLEINNVRLFLHFSSSLIQLLFHLHRMFRVGELSGLSVVGCLT